MNDRLGTVAEAVVSRLRIRPTMSTASTDGAKSRALAYRPRKTSRTGPYAAAVKAVGEKAGIDRRTIMLRTPGLP